jgi:threonine/homoserine/homoserine lactone efflux protein
VSLEELDRLFEDPANRPLGTFYCCAEDPRMIAPSRPGWRGFQINFAHPRAVPFFLFYLSVLIGPSALAALFGPQDPLLLTAFVSGVFFASVAFLVRLSRRLSGKHAT